MPNVGGEEFDYTPEGIAKAKAAAKSKGVSIEYGDNTQLKENGGMATGGKGGIDDVPAMLTEGEVVLNDKQQEAIGEIVGKDSNEVFAEAGVPGFEKNKLIGDIGMGHWINKYAEGGEVTFWEKVRRKFQEWDKSGKRKSADVKVKAKSKKPVITEEDVVKEGESEYMKHLKETKPEVAADIEDKTYIPKSTDPHTKKQQLKKMKSKVKETKGGDYPFYKEGSESEISKDAAFADARADKKKEYSWQGRKYHTRTAEEESAGKKTWDAASKKWVKGAKEMAGGGEVHAYQEGGKVGGMFDFPSKSARD